MHTRFRPGASGNPKGRPRGAKNLATLVSEGLDQRVVVTQDGRSRRISKREIVVAQLINRSAKADLKAMQILLGLVQEIERRADATAEPAALSEADRQVLQFIRDRRLGDQQGDSDAGQ